MDLFKRQRIALESGILSETILPLSELKFILKNSHEKGWSSANADWFYQYMRIDAIWHDDGHLVYRTSLPLTDHMYSFSDTTSRAGRLSRVERFQS